jgi:hypothetical protein
MYYSSRKIVEAGERVIALERQKSVISDWANWLAAHPLEIEEITKNRWQR